MLVHLLEDFGNLNGGQTWVTTTDFLTNLGVSDIAINPNNTDEIFTNYRRKNTYGYGLLIIRWWINF